MEDLAARARLSRRTLSKWEGSSNAVPDAMVAHLSRALDVLEAEGVRFSDSGVYGTRIRDWGPAAGWQFIKAIYCFHQNNDDSRCEAVHTSPPIRP